MKLISLLCVAITASGVEYAARSSAPARAIPDRLAT